MSEKETPRDKRGRDRSEGEGSGRKRLATWQIAVLVVAVVVMGAGIALGVAGAGKTHASTTSARSTSGPGHANSLVTGLAPSGGGRSASATETPAGQRGVSWSPVVFRLGFSAFVGFAIGYALRSFLKLSLFALGFFFLMLLGLQYAQIIEIHWGAMEERYNEASTWIGAQTHGFMGFVTGQLPAAGLGGAGLLAGLKRK